MAALKTKESTCSAIWMSYDPELFVRTMPRSRNSFTSTSRSTPADGVWYQRSFGAASSRRRTRSSRRPQNAISASRARERSASSLMGMTVSSGSAALMPPCGVDGQLDQNTMVGMSLAYYAAIARALRHAA